MDGFRPQVDDLRLDAAIPLDRLYGLRTMVVRGTLQPLILGSVAQAISDNPCLSDLVIVPRSPMFCARELFSKILSATSLPLRHLAVRASGLDLSQKVLRQINSLDSFDLEYTGWDPHVHLDLAPGGLLCRRLIVADVHLRLFTHSS